MSINGKIDVQLNALTNQAYIKELAASMADVSRFLAKKLHLNRLQRLQPSCRYFLHLRERQYLSADIQTVVIIEQRFLRSLSLI